MILGCPVPIEFVSGENQALQKNWHQVSFQDSSGASSVIGFILLSFVLQVQDVRESILGMLPDPQKTNA